MPYYQLDLRNFSDSALKKHAKKIEGLTIGAGEFLIDTNDDMSRIKGVTKLDVERADVVSGLKAEVEHGSPLAGLASLELGRDWVIEPYSTRKAEISHIPVTAGSQSLFVSLGGGRGNQVCLGTSLLVPKQARAISLRARAMPEEGESMSLGIVLTTGRERPWLELQITPLKSGAWQSITLPLDKLDKKKLIKTNRINLIIETASDEGFCQIQDLCVL